MELAREADENVFALFWSTWKLELELRASWSIVIVPKIYAMFTSETLHKMQRGMYKILHEFLDSYLSSEIFSEQKRSDK